MRRTWSGARPERYGGHRMNIPSRSLSIGDRNIGPENASYCIAEVGINHNGEVELAKKMIRIAKAAGADAVKFQTFKAEEFCSDRTQTFTYQSQGLSVTESMLEMFKRYEFSPQQWREIKEYSDEVGITFLSTPQNATDLALLLEIGIPAIKVGSDDFTNLPLIRDYTKAGLPLILSCGMSDLAEVHQALEASGWLSGRQVVLLLCTSEYPTSPQDVNLRKLTTLQHAFPGLLTGFSDHTQGDLAAGLAVALGGRVFEKHFTLDHGLPGPDHWFSEEPAGLKKWVATIRNAEMMMGSRIVMPTPGEREMRTLARRSVVALQDIAEGERLQAQNIGLRRPGDGLPPAMLDLLLGMVAARGIKSGEKIFLKDVRA